MKFPFPFKSSEITTTAAASSWSWPSCATSPRTRSFRAPDPHQHEASNRESAVASALRSERLFFEAGATSSALAEAESGGGGRESGSVLVVAVNSRDPFLDFRASMAEMVEGGGERDWGFLEALLEWYLRVNDESNHGYIVDAFVDLVMDEYSSSSASSIATDSFSSSSSSV
ncbi:transcription repressor OFP15-like [Salvia hispanica]|uniref:transcription repressor OFP15-like n=1 Tax=Salvia hispanica TaxID=49212 RepID=UPI002009C88F|nr:transcription repressor OFP15-like [Salvia hispanica]XP_047973952.1 transcription repressor OFP15-like [Salvia hispanica]